MHLSHCFLLLVLLPLLAVNAALPTTIASAKDASLIEISTSCPTNCKDDNFGKELILTSSPHTKMIVGFPSLPSMIQSNIQSVYLVFPKATSILGSQSVVVSSTHDLDWNEGSITWNSFSKYAQRIGNVDCSIMRSTKLDITNLFLNKEGEEVTLIFESEGTVVVPSKESGSQSFYLQIEYSEEKNGQKGTPQKPLVPNPEQNSVFSSSTANTSITGILFCIFIVINLL